MAKSRMNEQNETEIIAWAVPRIAGGHYAFSDGRNGRELWVFDRDPEIEEMEGELLYGRQDEKLKQSLLRLREECCLDNIRTVFALVLGKKLGEQLTQEFCQSRSHPQHYPLIVAVAYKQEKSLIADLQKILVTGKLGLSSSYLSNVEGSAIPEAVSVGVVSHFAQEVSNLFPKLIRRAEQLRIIPAQKAVPRTVQRYIEEASRCYIYGHFIACLIVCRSAIEFAVRDLLIEQGHKAELNDLKSRHEDTFDNVINHGRRLLNPRFRPTLDAADEVRVGSKSGSA